MTTKTGPARRPWCIRCAGYGHLKEKCFATVSVNGDNLKKRLPKAATPVLGASDDVARPGIGVTDGHFFLHTLSDLVAVKAAVFTRQSLLQVVAVHADRCNALLLEVAVAGASDAPRPPRGAGFRCHVCTSSAAVRVEIVSVLHRSDNCLLPRVVVHMKTKHGIAEKRGSVIDILNRHQCNNRRWAGCTATT
ncbi:unnamed protein product [Pylaiella littoralis]